MIIVINQRKYISDVTDCISKVCIFTAPADEDGTSVSIKSDDRKDEKWNINCCDGNDDDIWNAGQG